MRLIQIGKFGRRKMASSRNVGNSISPPTKEGILFKYRNFWSGWMQRYFKLDKCYLHYFETKHAPEPIDSIPRGSILLAKPSNAFQDKQYVFEIQHRSGTTWYAQASSMEEMIQWIQALSPVPSFLNPELYPTTPTMHPQTTHLQTAALNASDVRTSQQLYPNLSQEIYYEYNDNHQVSTQHGGPPPPYSEIVNHGDR